jgi:hypothetical protein
LTTSSPSPGFPSSSTSPLQGSRTRRGKWRAARCRCCLASSGG